MSENFDVKLFSTRILYVTALTAYARTFGDEAKHLWDIMIKANELSQFQNTFALTDKQEAQLADKVFRVQKELVDKVMVTNTVILEYYKQGRLLVCYMTCSTYMQTAEPVSKGFFDVMDHPPFCIWLYWFPATKKMVEHSLVWIPPEFVEDANEAVEMVAEQHYQFATDEDFKADYKPILAKADLLV